MESHTKRLLEPCTEGILLSSVRIQPKQTTCSVYRVYTHKGRNDYHAEEKARLPKSKG